MKKTSSLVPALLALTGMTAFIEPLPYRLAALLCFLAPALIIAGWQQITPREAPEERHGGPPTSRADDRSSSVGDAGAGTAKEDLHRQLASHSDALPRLADQLKDVIQQTEQAAVEINERFMSIAGRARQQLKATAEILAAEHPRDPATGRPEVKEQIELVTAETAMLSRDIQGIIVSLQFQDLTKQHIEKVIDQLQHLHEEIQLMRTQLQDMSTVDRGDKQTACVERGPGAVETGGGDILWPRNS